MMDESAVSKKSQASLGYYLRIIGTLFAITAVVAVALALVNQVTAPTIARRAEEKRQAALTQVMPDAEYVSFDYHGSDPAILDIQGAYREGKLAGYCVQVTTNGFGGAINMMVGVDAVGKVTGVSILSMSETAGLGARASEPGFLGQFQGLSGQPMLKKDDAQRGEIDAISGATITSRAVTHGVDAALEAVATLDEEGGDAS